MADLPAFTTFDKAFLEKHGVVAPTGEKGKESGLDLLAFTFADEKKRDRKGDLISYSVTFKDGGKISGLCTNLGKALGEKKLCLTPPDRTNKPRAPKGDTPSLPTATAKPALAAAFFGQYSHAELVAAGLVLEAATATALDKEKAGKALQEIANLTGEGLAEVIALVEKLKAKAATPTK